MNRYLYTNVYSIIIQNSQKVETTQASTARCMDKENVYTHSGLSFIITDTWYKWVKLKDTNPREISHHKRTNTAGFHLHEVLSVAEFTESGMAVVRQIRGGGDAELVPNRLELQLGKVKNS